MQPPKVTEEKDAQSESSMQTEGDHLDNELDKLLGIGASVLEKIAFRPLDPNGTMLINGKPASEAGRAKGRSKQNRSGQARSIKELVSRAKQLPVVFSKIKPPEEPATYYLELPNEKTAEAIAILQKSANTNVFHRVSRTRHADLLKVELTSAMQKAKLEEIVGSGVTVHESDPFKDRVDNRLFVILDFELSAGEKLTYESARKMLVEQNKDLFENVKVTRLFTGRPCGLVFAVRNEETAMKVLEQRFVNFGLYRPIATSYCPVGMCMRCCAYDHPTNVCSAGFVVCARCAGRDHAIETCKKKSTRCFYCAARGEDDRHPATSLGCPYRRDLMEEMAKKNSTKPLSN